MWGERLAELIEVNAGVINDLRGTDWDTKKEQKQAHEVISYLDEIHIHLVQALEEYNNYEDFIKKENIEL